MLKSQEFGISLTAKQYYNLVRRISANKDNPETIDALLVALEDAGFIYRTKIKLGRILRINLFRGSYNRSDLSIESSLKPLNASYLTNS